jgi:hypothetical protein
MSVTPNKDTEENREYWAFVEKTSDEVRKWPAWMRGDYSNRENNAKENQSAIDS